MVPVKRLPNESVVNAVNSPNWEGMAPSKSMEGKQREENAAKKYIRRIDACYIRNWESSADYRGQLGMIRWGTRVHAFLCEKYVENESVADDNPTIVKKAMYGILYRRLSAELLASSLGWP